MFWRAPAAASRVVLLISQRCSTWLYNSTIWGCHSHSIPFGNFDTSANVVRSWFCLWKQEETLFELQTQNATSLVKVGHFKLIKKNEAAPHIFGLFALRGETADRFALWRTWRTSGTLQSCLSWRGDLIVQLKGQIPQNTYSILHTLKEESSCELPFKHTDGVTLKQRLRFGW